MELACPSKIEEAILNEEDLEDDVDKVEDEKEEEVIIVSVLNKV